MLGVDPHVRRVGPSFVSTCLGRVIGLRRTVWPTRRSPAVARWTPTRCVGGGERQPGGLGNPLPVPLLAVHRPRDLRVALALSLIRSSRAGWRRPRHVPGNTTRIILTARPASRSVHVVQRRGHSRLRRGLPVTSPDVLGQARDVGGDVAVSSVRTHSGLRVVSGRLLFEDEVAELLRAAARVLVLTFVSVRAGKRGGSI